MFDLCHISCGNPRGNLPRKAVSILNNNVNTVNEYFKGKKLSRFRDFWQNSRKFVPAKYLLSINREVYSREKNKSRLAKVKKSKN